MSIQIKENQAAPFTSKIQEMNGDFSKINNALVMPEIHVQYLPASLEALVHRDEMANDYNALLSPVYRLLPGLTAKYPYLRSAFLTEGDTLITPLSAGVGEWIAKSGLVEIVGTSASGTPIAQVDLGSLETYNLFKNASAVVLGGIIDVNTLATANLNAETLEELVDSCPAVMNVLALRPIIEKLFDKSDKLVKGSTDNPATFNKYAKCDVKPYQSTDESALRKRYEETNSKLYEELTERKPKAKKDIIAVLEAYFMAQGETKESAEAKAKDEFDKISKTTERKTVTYFNNL